MTKKQIISKLEKIAEILDEIQETETLQDNEEAMDEIGEAIGSIENLLDILDE